MKPKDTDEESTVNSIYFDDLSMASCRANYDGYSIRTKLRIRWYDSEFPVKTFYFEIKRRNGQMIRKDRMSVDIKEDLKDMPYERLLFLLGRILPHEYVESIMLRPNPIVLIEYKRKH